jgi:putative Ca2+/H+ antiporter (TMEM165/GDT1 family)
MKNNLLLGESVVSILLIVLLVIFLNPSRGLWMPSMLMSMVLLIFVVVFIVFAVFVWKETTRDEREEQHRQRSGRVSFLCGAACLVIGIVTQTLHGRLDPWLLGALSAMVLAKIGTRLYYHFSY